MLRDIIRFKGEHLKRIRELKGGIALTRSVFSKIISRTVCIIGNSELCPEYFHIDLSFFPCFFFLLIIFFYLRSGLGCFLRQISRV